MTYTAKVAVCSEIRTRHSKQNEHQIRTKHSKQNEHHVEFLNIKPGDK